MNSPHNIGNPNGAIVHDLTEGSVSWGMIRFAVPLMLSGMLQTVYNLTDLVIVGHWIGKDGLGAVSIGGDVLHFLMFVAIGFSNAGQVVIAQYTGAGEKEKASRTAGAIFTTFFACAVLLGGTGLLFRRELLSLINTPPEAWEHTLNYTSVCMTGLVFIYGYNAVSAILRGMGDSRHPFYFIAFAAVLNVVLDLFFIVVLHLSVFGAALATVCSQGTSFIAALLFLYRRREEFGFAFRLRDFRIHPGIFSVLLKLGIPMVIQSASIQFSMMFVNSWINSFGIIASAMTGIGNKLTGIIHMVNIAFSQAGSTMIGQNIGAAKYDRVPKVLRVSLSINAALAVLAGTAAWLFPRVVFGIFTTDPVILERAPSYIPVLLLLLAGSALRTPMNSLINGSGNFHLNFAVALFDGIIVRIGLALLLGLAMGMGVYGFWYGHAIAGFTPFVIGGLYLVSGRWRTQKYIIRKKERDGRKERFCSPRR